MLLVTKLHLLVVFVLIIINLFNVADSIGPKKSCLLESRDGNLNCRYVDPSDKDILFTLDDCNLGPKDPPSCLAVINITIGKNPTLCHIKLVIKNWAEVINNLILNRAKCSRVHYSIDIELEQMSESTARKHLFKNSKDVPWREVVIKNTTFVGSNESTTFESLLMNNFAKAKAIKLIDVKTLPALEYNHLIKSPNIEAIQIIDSSIYGLKFESFQIRTTNTRVELNRVEFLNGSSIELGAFMIYNNCNNETAQDGGLDISITNIKSGTQIFSPGFIKIDDWDTNCKPTIRLNLKNNPDLQILPALRIFLESIKNLEMVLYLDLDDISCCDQDNRWFLNSLNETLVNANASRHVPTIKYGFKCKDSEMTLEEFAGHFNESSLCPKKFWQTALTWLIISILILVSMLCIFSYVCVYYVIPKKSEVIMVQGRNIITNSRASAKMSGGSAAASRASGQHLELTSTQMDVPSAKTPGKPANKSAKSDVNKSPIAGKDHRTRAKRHLSPALKRRNVKSAGSTKSLGETKKKARFKLPMNKPMKLPGYKSATRSNSKDTSPERKTIDSDPAAKTLKQQKSSTTKSLGKDELNRLTDRSHSLQTKPMGSPAAAKTITPKSDDQTKPNSADKLLAQGKQIKSITSDKSASEQGADTKSPTDQSKEQERKNDKATKKSNYSDRMSLALRTIN